MTLIIISEAVAAIAGLALAVLIFAARRFGPGSSFLSGFLLAPALAAGFLAYNGGDTAYGLLDARISFASLLVAMPLALVFIWTLNQPELKPILRRRIRTILTIGIPVPILLAALFLIWPMTEPSNMIPAGFVALGPAGYLSSLYLLVISVLCLAALEQVARSAEESVRWEIKFLLIGLGGAAAAVLYIGSKVLLYSFRYALVPTGSLQVFPFIFILTCVLTFASWKRSSGRGQIAVSQSLVYSSITLLGVGLYLIASSLIARWISQWEQPGIEAEAIIFLVSIIILGTVIFWTGFRHRARLWIHRHIFAGRYDYRQYWIEASEKIRYTDGLEAAANGLAAVTHRALDAIDITVWLRARNPNRLELLASLGSISETCEKQIPGVVEKLVEVNIPMFKRELANRSDLGLVMELLQMANGELLVPLVSSDRLVGVMTVGSNRSGHPLDHEAIEFLRVLSGHAASEIHKAELLDTLFEAKEAEAFKNFATFVLHDLKNFASTLSLIARNSARYQDNPEFQKDAFHSVYDTAEKMKRLCNNLRLFSSTLAANRKPEDLNALVRTAVAELGTGMDCELHLELGEVPAIELDRDEIGRVLQNLILNARQAMQTRGAIVIRTGVHGGNVELVVEDTGKGMPREFLEKRLFLPFHTTKSDGLGIGLFQCKKIIEAHGGTISVTSVEGKGTIVTVRFGLGR